MFRHAIILAVAVAVALGMAQEMAKISCIRDQAPAAQSAPPQDPAAMRAIVAAASTSPATVGPAPSVTTTSASLAAADAQVVKAADGHYWADAQVNGRPIRFLVDTGASFVALTRGDAEQLGLNPGALTYDAPVITANGRTQAAKVQLDYVAVSGARVEQVPAMVIADGLSTSLLGMSYLGRLSRFEATPTSLILRP